MTSRRAEELKIVAEEFGRVHDEWADDPRRPHPDAIYWDASDAMLDSFATGEIPDESRELAEAVENYRQCVEEFDERDDPGHVPMPAAEFWTAREKISAAIAKKSAPPLPPLESIPSLKLLPGITDLQIAKIYGLKDRHGNYLTHLVQQELDQPGSVIKTPGAVDGRDWKDPRVKDNPGDTTAQRRAAAISEKRKKAGKTAPKAEDKPAGTPCTETPRELWLLDPPITISQAAKMLCKEEGEVAQLFQGFESERDAEIASGEGMDAVSQAIREKHAAGMGARAIAKELKIDPNRVSAVLKAALKPKEAA
jgi:hypothetical protein